MFPWLSMILVNILSGDDIQNGRRYLTKSFETWGINSIKPYELCKFNHFHLIVFTRSTHTRYDICWLLRVTRHIKWNIFRVTWPLWGEPRGHRWIPLTRPVARSFLFSLICAWTKGWINNRYAGDLRRHRAHYDVTAMLYALTLHIKWNVFRVTCPLWGGSPITGGFHSKGQWRGVLMFSLICTWTNDRVKSRDASEVRHLGPHYDVTYELSFAISTISRHRTRFVEIIRIDGIGNFIIIVAPHERKGSKITDILTLKKADKKMKYHDWPFVKWIRRWLTQSNSDAESVIMAWRLHDIE